jgi:hypothetical protein
MAKKNEKNRKKHERRRIEHYAHLEELAALNRFRIATMRYLTAMGIPDLFKAMHKEDIEAYYRTRIGTVRLIPEPGIKFQRRTLNMMRDLLSAFLKQTIIKEKGGSFTLEDHVTAGLALAGSVSRFEDTRHESTRNAIKLLAPIVNYYTDKRKEPARQLKDMVSIIQSYFSRINGTMYYLTKSNYYKVRERDNKFCYSIAYELHQVKAVIRNIMIDGKPRPVYKAGWPRYSEGIIWKTISEKDLGIDGEKTMDLYIQSHAFIRLRERIDTLDHFCLNLTLSNTLDKKEITIQPGGKALLAYYALEHKLGYFVLDILEDLVVIKTFLFITNTGCPEGDRLDSELNVGKFEKEYVGIDKLSTFVQSDLMKNEKVLSVFEKVGLGYLKDFDSSFFNSKKIQKKGYAADFLRYINFREE